MRLIIEHIADPYAIAAILFLTRPILLVLLLVAMFNIQRNRNRYSPIDKRDVFFVGVLFAIVFILAPLVLGLFLGKTPIVSDLFVSSPAVSYGTILIAYTCLFASIFRLLRKKNIDLRWLLNVRCDASILYIFPCLLILILLGAKAFSSVFGIGVITFSGETTGLGYMELAFRIVMYLILIPLTEELFFRGVVYNSLLNYYRKHWAAILVAGYFAIGHLSYFPSLMLWFFLKGLIYIGLYEKYKSLVPGIVLHGLTNIPVLV